MRTGLAIMVILVSLFGCAETKKCDPWITFCQEQYKQCKERERKKMEPNCRQLYGEVKDCQAAGQLFRGSYQQCSAFSAKKGAEYNELAIGLGIAVLCQEYCTKGKTDEKFPSYSDFEKEQCIVSPEKSECTRCPNCP